MVPIAKGRKCQWACRGHLTREVFFVRRQCHLVPIIKEKNRPMTLSWGPILGGEKVKIALSCVPNDKVFCGKKCHLAPIAEGRRCQLPCSGNQTIRYIHVRRLYLPIAEKRMGLSWTQNILQRRECAYGPVLDTKHMRHFCKVTMPYGTNHQREKRVNGSVFGTNPGGKKVAMTLSWASSR